VNYTLVGDVVNIAQRLEQLGKEVDGAGDVVALITEDSHSCLKNKEGAILVDRRAVRDRDGEIGIYRLV
jgi:class 3 adenylate cyclase